MINKDVIQFLYKKAKHPTKEFNKEFLDAVSEKCGKFHHVKFTDEYMIIDDLDTQNPFRNIRLSCIRRIEEIGEYVAVVLNSCIILFNNHTGKISINLRNSIGNKSCTTNPFKRLFHFSRNHNKTKRKHPENFSRCFLLYIALTVVISLESQEPPDPSDRQLPIFRRDFQQKESYLPT